MNRTAITKARVLSGRVSMDCIGKYSVCYNDTTNVRKIGGDELFLYTKAMIGARVYSLLSEERPGDSLVFGLMIRPTEKLLYLSGDLPALARTSLMQNFRPLLPQQPWFSLSHFRCLKQTLGGRARSRAMAKDRAF